MCRAEHFVHWRTHGRQVYLSRGVHSVRPHRIAPQDLPQAGARVELLGVPAGGGVAGAGWAIPASGFRRGSLFCEDLGLSQHFEKRSGVVVAVVARKRAQCLQNSYQNRCDIDQKWARIWWYFLWGEKKFQGWGQQHCHRRTDHLRLVRKFIREPIDHFIRRAFGRDCCWHQGNHLF